MEHHFRAGRQLRRHFGFLAAKEEGADSLAELLELPIISRAKGIAKAAPRIRHGSERARVEELKLAPGIIQAIFDRRSRKSDAEISAQAVSRARDLRIRVF